MARPSKYNSELKDRIAGYIADGLTVRDACYGAGITEDTFWRWSREKVEFAEVIKQATAKAKQKWSSEALMRTSEYRRYTRKAHICSRKPLNSHPPRQPKAPKSSSNGFREHICCYDDQTDYRQ